MPLNIIRNMSGEILDPTFTHQIMSSFVYHIVYSAPPEKQNMSTDQIDAWSS